MDEVFATQNPGQRLRGNILQVMGLVEHQMGLVFDCIGFILAQKVGQQVGLVGYQYLRSFAVRELALKGTGVKEGAVFPAAAGVGVYTVSCLAEAL